jgi:branched-chain amino acid transport system substrate-binding protein
MERSFHRLVLLLAATALLASCGAPSTGTPSAGSASPSASGSTSGSTSASASGSASASASGSAAAGGSLSGEIPVGFAFALTGDAAVYGTSQKNAVDLAVEEINSSGFLGGATMRAVIEDDAGRPETATTVFEKLINEDEVVAIIGPTLSNAALSSDPIAQENGVPVVAVSNTAAGITEIGDFIFRASLPESAVIPNTVQVAKEKLGFTKVAIMYANDDAFSKSGYDVFKAALQENGVEILTEETFAGRDTDFSAQLTKIKGLNPDALIVSALVTPASGILTQAQQLGLAVPIIGGNGFNSPDLTRLAGEAANGAISGAAYFVANENAKNTAFVQAYNAKYGKNPDQFAAQAYAGTYLLAEAIRNAGSTDRAAIRDALDQLQNVDTVLGTFSFNNREPEHPPIVQQLENGAFKLFE